MLPSLFNLRINAPTKAPANTETTSDSTEPAPILHWDGEKERSDPVIKTYSQTLSNEWQGLFMQPQRKVERKGVKFVVLRCKYCDEELLIRASSFNSNRGRRLHEHFMNRCRDCPFDQPPLRRKRPNRPQVDNFQQFLFHRDEDDGTAYVDYHELGNLAAAAWRRRRRGPWKRWG